MAPDACPTPDPRRDLGALGEQLAADHLARRGFRILARNYRTRLGELDIVAFDGTTLAFVEVKARRRSNWGTTPLDSVGPRKRRQVQRMARSWLSDTTDRPFARSLRFDAIGVTLDPAGGLVSLEHLEDAF